MDANNEISDIDRYIRYTISTVLKRYKKIYYLIHLILKFNTLDQNVWIGFSNTT